MSDSGKITVNYFCLGAFFIFIGSVLLCALGFTVVLPFEVTRGWPEVTCTVVNSTYNPNVCSCDEQLNVFDTCVSKYPCLQIQVVYIPASPDIFRPRPNRTVGHVPPESARRGGADRKPRRPEWIIEDTVAEPVFVPLNSSRVQGEDLTTEAGTVVIPEKSVNFTEFVVEHPNRADVHDFRGVASNLVEAVASTTSYPVTSTYRHATTKASVKSEEADHIHHRPLLLSTLLPFSDPPLKDDVYELKEGSNTADSIPGEPQSKNWTESFRKSDYEREDGGDHVSLAGIDLAREDTNHGTKAPPAVFATLYRSWDDSFHRQCTLTECGDETWNVKEARRFKVDWGRFGQSFTCFYNPLRPDMVIIERTSTVAAVHAVLWPGLCLIGGITLWLGLCLGCWSLRSESCKDDYGPIY